MKLKKKKQFMKMLDAHVKSKLAILSLFGERGAANDEYLRKTIPNAMVRVCVICDNQDKHRGEIDNRAFEEYFYKENQEEVENLIRLTQPKYAKYLIKGYRSYLHMNAINALADYPKC